MWGMSNYSSGKQLSWYKMATPCKIKEYETENLNIKEARNGKIWPILEIKIIPIEAW